MNTSPRGGWAPDSCRTSGCRCAHRRLPHAPPPTSVPGHSKNLTKPAVAPLLCVWGGEPVGRANAVPHVKTLARFSQAGRLAWLLLGSHNFSAAAWGSVSKPGTSVGPEGGWGWRGWE